MIIYKLLNISICNTFQLLTFPVIFLRYYTFHALVWSLTFHQCVVLEGVFIFPPVLIYILYISDHKMLHCRFFIHLQILYSTSTNTGKLSFLLTGPLSCSIWWNRIFVTFYVLQYIQCYLLYVFQNNVVLHICTAELREEVVEIFLVIIL